jgi:hypothetical protein
MGATSSEIGCAPPPRLYDCRARAWSVRMRRICRAHRAKKCARFCQSIRFSSERRRCRIGPYPVFGQPFCHSATLISSRDGSAQQRRIVVTHPQLRADTISRLSLPIVQGVPYHHPRLVYVLGRVQKNFEKIHADWPERANKTRRVVKSPDLVNNPVGGHPVQSGEEPKGEAKYGDSTKRR